MWVVGITNAMNLIDGLDGLAGGISAIYFLMGTPECFLKVWQTVDSEQDSAFAISFTEISLVKFKRT